MHDPELLILDEPTSGLDPLRQRDVLELVRERAAAGRTVFLSSHELDQVEHAADRVGIVRDGRLVAVEASRPSSSAPSGGSRSGWRSRCPGSSGCATYRASAGCPSATGSRGSTSRARWTRS
jgi:energy-coupling factor transporter ATP-binding protein EcfA2